MQSARFGIAGSNSYKRLVKTTKDVAPAPPVHQSPEHAGIVNRPDFERGKLCYRQFRLGHGGRKQASTF